MGIHHCIGWFLAQFCVVSTRYFSRQSGGLSVCTLPSFGGLFPLISLTRGSLIHEIEIIWKGGSDEGTRKSPKKELVVVGG